MEKNVFFVKFIERSLEFYELIEQRPTAFVLLAIIVERALKTPLDMNDSRQVGEAFIGDYKTYGATPQSYRTDKKYLEKFKIATFRSTSKGTVAKVIKSSIFDISRTSSTSRSTNWQQTSNDQATTKQDIRNEIKERESLAKPMEKKDFFHEITPNTPANSSIKHKNSVSEAYWNKNAPRIANDMNIEMYSDKYENAKEDWLKKAKIATLASIRAFLENANDWEMDQYLEQNKQ